MLRIFILKYTFAGQPTVSGAVIYLTPKWLARIQRVHPQTRRPALASGMSSVLHRSCLWPSGTGGPHHCRSIRNAGAGLQWSTAAPHYSYPSLLAAPLGARSCHGMGALWVSLYQVCPWHASPHYPLPSHPIPSQPIPPPPPSPPPWSRESRPSGWGTGGASWCQLQGEISKVADTCPNSRPPAPTMHLVQPCRPIVGKWGANLEEKCSQRRIKRGPNCWAPALPNDIRKCCRLL